MHCTNIVTSRYFKHLFAFLVIKRNTKLSSQIIFIKQTTYQAASLTLVEGCQQVLSFPVNNASLVEVCQARVFRVLYGVDDNLLRDPAILALTPRELHARTGELQNIRHRQSPARAPSANVRHCAIIDQFIT